MVGGAGNYDYYLAGLYEQIQSFKLQHFFVKLYVSTQLSVCTCKIFVRKMYIFFVFLIKKKIYFVFVQTRYPLTIALSLCGVYIWIQNLRNFVWSKWHMWIQNLCEL